LKDGVHHDNFISHWFVKGYYKELSDIGKAVYADNKDKLKDEDCLYREGKNGKKSFIKTKLLSYMYHHFERNVMDTAFAGFEKNIKIMVHDGCYIEGLSDKDLRTIEGRFADMGLTVSID
jgi:hypothetical protein